MNLLRSKKEQEISIKTEEQHEIFQQNRKVRPLSHAQIRALRKRGGEKGEEALPPEHRPARYRYARGLF